MNQRASGLIFSTQSSIFAAVADLMVVRRPQVGALSVSPALTFRMILIRWFSPDTFCGSWVRITLLTPLNRFWHLSEVINLNVIMELDSSHSHQEASRLKLPGWSDVARQVIA
jgi:hypothetical protein